MNSTYAFNLTFTRADEQHATVHTVGFNVEAADLATAERLVRARNAHLTLQAVEHFATLTEDGEVVYTTPQAAAVNAVVAETGVVPVAFTPAQQAQWADAFALYTPELFASTRATLVAAIANGDYAPHHAQWAGVVVELDKAAAIAAERATLDQAAAETLAWEIHATDAAVVAEALAQGEVIEARALRVGDTLHLDAAHHGDQARRLLVQGITPGRAEGFVLVSGLEAGERRDYPLHLGDRVIVTRQPEAAPVSRLVRYVNTPTPELRDGDLVFTHGVLFRLRDRKPTSTGENGWWFKTDVVVDLDPARTQIPSHWLLDWTVQGNQRAVWARVIDPLPALPEGETPLFVYAGTTWDAPQATAPAAPVEAEDDDEPSTYRPEGAVLYDGTPGSGSWRRPSRR